MSEHKMRIYGESLRTRHDDRIVILHRIADCQCRNVEMMSGLAKDANSATESEIALTMTTKICTCDPFTGSLLTDSIIP